MNEDGNTPERFELPKSFAEASDPVGGNPFPPEHPAHGMWLDATRQAEAEVCRLNAAAHTALTLETAGEWMPTLVVAKFDVWAKRGVRFVWTDQAEQQYAVWLVDYANEWIEPIARYFTTHPPPFPADRFLADLQRRLGARVQHWRTEALRYRVQQDAHAAAAASRVQRQPSPELVKRRRDAIERYRDAKGLDALAFARKVGVSESVIRAIVREDKTRFKSVAQERLLEAIGTTREEWYRE